MTERKKILLPRSSIPGRAPTLNEIDFGEIAINTHDGKAFIKRDRDGEVTVESIGSEAVDNVYYVSKSGEYGNDGRSLMNSFKTVDSAVARVTALQGFKFNEEICERDLHLIMDAVRYDMLLETNFNSVTAGNSYKRGNAIKVTTDQKYQTRRSINEERVGMISAPSVAANATATERIVNGFTEIIDIFYDGEADELYFTDPPVEAQADANAAALVLQNNRTAIQDAVVTYINNSYIAPYDQEKCSRDVGLILDAIADDLILGTNYNTITAGFSYKRANSAYVLSDQREITISAINYAIGQLNVLPSITSDATILSLVDNVTDVLENPDSAAYGAGQFVLDYNNTVGATYQTADRLTASTALQTNRSTIINDLTTYIQGPLGLTNYDSAKCERDTGFIVDALSYDIQYGGNTAARKNAEAYFVGTVNQLGYDSAEIVATAAAYEQLKVITDTYVTTAPEQARVDELLDTIIEVIEARSLSVLDAEVDIDVGGLDNTERAAIEVSKSDIQDLTIDYVDQTWAVKTTNIKSYDAGKCSRDVGLIVDAVARDLILGTNYNTNTAGWAYTRANSAYVLSDQKEATIEAVQYAKRFLSAREGVLQDSAIGVLFDNVINVIDGTQTTYPTMTYPQTPSATYQSSQRVQAVTDLQIQRQPLIDGVSTFIASNYPNFVYDSAACERDTGYIIDALSHDIQYGGNTATITNAEAYFVGTETQRADIIQLGDSEVLPTIAAYNHLKGLINSVVSTGPEQTRASSLLDIINEVLEDRSLDNLDATVDIDKTGLDTAEYEKILSNKDETQDAVVAFVDENFAQKASLPDYGQQKCYRDVGLILDAVRRDLILQTDYNTITAAFAYARANSVYVLSDQKEYTIRAINFARDAVKALPEVTSDATVDTLFKRITDVLNGYVKTYTTPTYATLANGNYQQDLDGERITFADDIQTNRQSLIDEVIDQVNLEYPNANFSDVTCGRDLGYILDALCHDVKYGGNTASRQNATAYFVGTQSQLGLNTEVATAYAYEILKGSIATLIGSYVNLATITATVDGLLDIIIDVIEAGNLDAIPDEIDIITSGLTTTQYAAIEAGTPQIQDDTIEYVNDFYFNPAYDQAKCARDVGEIIDAISVALRVQDDFPIQIVRQSYLRENAQEVYLKQRAATIAAVNKLEDLILAQTSDPTVETEIQGFFVTIKAGINRLDTSDLPYPDATSATQTAGGVDDTGVTAQTRAVIDFFVNNDPGNEDEIITYITNTIGLAESEYDSAKCRRDLDIIFKSIAFDTAVGGTWATTKTAQAYFAGVVNQLGNDTAEISATINAYKYIKTQTIDTNFEAAAAGLGITTQKDSIKSYLNALLDTIIETLEADDSSTIPAEVFPSTDGVTSPRSTEIETIEAGKTLWQNNIIDFVNDSNPVNAFDDEKCARDTGLIIDAITLDLENNTNYNSITAGLAYQRGNAEKVQSDQLKYTVQSINYLRDLLVGTDSLSTAGAVFITARIKEITELLTQSTDYGATDGDLIFATTGLDQDKINAFNALRANRRQLEIETTSWILENFPGFEYDLKKCERDVGYIVDGLCHDVLYGGQYASETIARSYWVERDLNIEGNADQTLNLDGQADTFFKQLGQGEASKTILAYEQLKRFIEVKVGTDAERARVNALLTIVIDSIGAVDNTLIPNTGLPISSGDAQAIAGVKLVSTRETVLYANKVFPAYTYDQAKCRRDVGFILDALTYDLKYGGNSATSIAMRSYFSIFNNGYGDLLGDNEFTMTIQAYRYLKRYILPSYLNSLAVGIKNTYKNLLDIILNAIIQTNQGTYQLGEFFANNRQDLYQYNYPTGLAAGYNTQTFPDLIALGYKVTFNELYNIHQDFNVASSQRLTIIRSSSAVARNQGTDSTIFVKSGDYIINNPIKLPSKTSIIGDALRSVTMRPKNVDSDFFWADNGVYIKEITFRDHQDGAAVLAYNPNVDSPGAGPFITQSPYVQNCTSLTTSGTGLRIDGSKVSGLRSMVLDAFTQFNAGGLGVYLLNRGYAQLVSLFTVSTTTSVLTETGGQCSLTNSNSSFGEFGLVSRGGSPKLYAGSLYANYITNDDVIRVNTIITNDSADYTLNIGDFKKPNYNDALKFDSENYYYTVTDVSDEITQDWAQTGNTEESTQLATNSQTNNGRFGHSVHMSGNDVYSIISEVDDGAGRAEIYTQDLVGGVPTWSYQALLQPTPPFGSLTDSDQFGDKVLLTTDGAFAAVSAPGQKQVDGTSTNKKNGQLYIFERIGENWAQNSTLQLAGLTDRDRMFSQDFDFSEDGLTVAVGTKNDLNSVQGVVYIYTRPDVASSTWTLIDTMFCPDGPSADVNEPSITVSKDGSDLVIHWRGALNKMYYYQRNIDNKYILAQVIVPKSNYQTSREGVVRMNPESTHMIFGDRVAPRGIFENRFTDANQGVSPLLQRKQNLLNISFDTPSQTITTTDLDIDFTKEFPTNTRVRVKGSASNDGYYNISSRTSNTMTFSSGFASDTTESEVQLYLDSAGVTEYFVFFEGQWVTEDILEAANTEVEGFGYGASVDINTEAKLAVAGNNPKHNSAIQHKVTVAERKRSDWQRVSNIQPQTAVNIGNQGKNDNFGFGGNAVATGGTGDLLLIGAPERRVTDTDAGTEYGSAFFYYSILPATGSFEITVSPPLNSNKKIEQNIGFHQRSLITASGHTFEYVGSGTNMFTAIPQNGGIPKKENEIVFDSAEAATPNFGLVYFTATDELGDFRIGENLRINREEGTITGDTFDRSLFAVLTPFILALEG